MVSHIGERQSEKHSGVNHEGIEHGETDAPCSGVVLGLSSLDPGYGIGPWFSPLENSVLQFEPR
jgi:hypothetical protein